MRSPSLIVVAVVVAATSGCVMFNAPVVPPTGVIYTKWKAPLTTDFKNTKRDGKVGRAETHHIMLWPISSMLSLTWDDASIEKAAANGGISQVAYADYEWTQVLGIYANLAVIAHGE